MTQFYSRIDTEFHGDVYSIPFSYINKDEIEVYLDDVLFVDWEFLNESQIKFKNLPSEASNPTMVSIRRNTDISEKIVEYTNNTLLNKENLNLSQDQLLYAVQEIYDNNTQFNIDLNASVDEKMAILNAEVDEKVEKVTEAVEQLHVLDEAVINAVNAAETATEQANIAIEKSELTASTADKALESIEILSTNFDTKAANALSQITTEGAEQIANIESTGFYMRDDKLYYINSEGVETEFESGSGSGFNLFDTKTSDHILEGDEALGWALQGTYVYKEGVAGSRTGYADFYNRCLAEKELGTATETTLGDNTITMYINGNGHKFYDIADKDVVDTWYNTYGIADYYGIDTANERIFLPRNDYFVQLTGDISKVNDYIEAGLPNIEGTYKSQAMTLDTNVTSTGALSYLPNNSYHRATGTAGTGSGINFDASLSNPIYGNSDTVQPPSSLKLLYYCVGNTKAESAISNVTEITTSENDTLPLFYNFYSKEDMTTTGSYVNASLGTYLSGNVYTTAYNELVNKLGTDNVKANTDTYTDYDFVVNQDEMSFRLPLLNGERVLVETKKPSTDDNTWYNLYSDGWLEQGGPHSSTVTYPKSFRDTSYTITMSGDYSANGADNNISALTATGYTGVYKTNQVVAQWQASGYTEVPTVSNLYYKVANAVTNLELLDVAKVTADLNTCYKKNDSDNSILSGLGMPSNKFIDLELGASGTTYTAPANGWFSLSRRVSSADISIILTTNKKMYSRSVSTTTGTQTLKANLPVAKGDTLTVEWNGNTTGTYEFYFVYAEGEV